MMNDGLTQPMLIVRLYMGEFNHCSVAIEMSAETPKSVLKLITSSKER